MANLGFVGLGVMGGRIAKRLLDAGHTVSGYNRTRAKAENLIQAGLQWQETPRAVVEAADITLSMVTDSAALSSVFDGPDGLLAGLGPGKIYVDMSTVSPRLSREMAARVAERGAEMLDAPVSGSVPAAETGTLIIFVGGNEAALERVRPVVESISQKIVYLGPSGTAISTKIAINLNLPAQLIALFEGVLLAERSGLSRAAALDALLNSVVAAPAMKYRAPLILNMPEEVWFSVRMMQKDLDIAEEMGAELGVPLHSVKLAQNLLAEAVALGWGDEDFAALFRVLEHQANKNQS